MAKALNCSIASVRRMEGDLLHPTRDPDGAYRFDPMEVLAVHKVRSARAVDPTREGERDARAFEILDSGGGIRDVVAQLRIPAALAERLHEQWRRAGARDVVVTPQLKAELVRYLGTFRDARELVQRAREQSAEIKLQIKDCEANARRTNEAAVVIGLLAARNPALADALPDLRAKLGADASEALDRALEWGQSAGSAITDSAAREEALREPRSIARPPGIACAASADVPSTLAEPPAASPMCAEEQLEAAMDPSAASDRADVPAEAPGAGASAPPITASTGSDRGRKLDGLLASLIADDARLQSLAALLKRGEAMMLAELARGIGTPEDGKRMENLDVLLLSLSGDPARLERIAALLTPAELDLLTELGRELPG